MQEQLKMARGRGWLHSGVTPLGAGKVGEFDSINERRTFESLRVFKDIDTVDSKPPPVKWVDSGFTMRTYRADANVALCTGDRVLLEMKPKGKLERDRVLRAKYQDIGRYLAETTSTRFALVEWEWSTDLARNIALLAKYWDVDPGTWAIDAFNAIGDSETQLGRLLDTVAPPQRTAVWAALATQSLTTDLNAGRLTRDSWVSLPDVIYPPLTLTSLIHTWWA
jgi:hypothetical protein